MKKLLFILLGFQTLGASQADLVIFSYDRPMQLYALLESIQTHVTGIGAASVIYRVSDARYEAGYSIVRRDFPHVRFIAQGIEPSKDFKKLTLAAAFDTPNPYLLFAVDDIIVTDRIDLAHASEQLEATGAYGFFFRLGLHHNYCYMNKEPMPVPDMREVAQGVYQWKFWQGTGEWGYPNSLDMVLYRKRDIAHELQTMRWPESVEKITFTSPNRMEAIWAAQWARSPDERTGLCYANASIINIPANLVQDLALHNRHGQLYSAEQLLELFLAGKKIDIAPLRHVRGPSVHMEIPYNFIEREASVGEHIPEKPFVVIIASYNNEKWAEANVRSVFAQRYSNWRVIYINDCSGDNTADVVERMCDEYGMRDRVTIIHNEQRVGALANIDRAVRSCRDHEIVVSLDGDDTLPHEDVLGLLNEVYTDPAIWITYGQYRNYPDNGIGVCQPIPKSVVYQNSFRELQPFVISHLRTFYAWLYKEIKVQDLQHEGRYLPMAWDMAFMIPMLEMARVNFKYLPYELYTYNMANPINDFKVDLGLSQWCDQYVRSKQKYERVYNSKIRSVASAHKADLIIFSFDNPSKLARLLASCQRSVTGLAQVTVLYRTSSVNMEHQYLQVKSKYPAVEFVDQGSKPLLNFQPLLLVSLCKSYANYVMFATDDAEVAAPVDVQSCVDCLVRTEAYAFYLGFTYNEQAPQGRSVDNDKFSWVFRNGTGQWSQPHTLHMAIYRKQDLQEDLMKTSYINPTTLLNAWQPLADCNKCGVCYRATLRVVHA